MSQHQNIIARIALNQIKDGMLYADGIPARSGRYSVLNVSAASSSHPPYYPLLHRGFQIITGFDHAWSKPFFAWHVTKEQITTAQARMLPNPMNDIIYARDTAALIGLFIKHLDDVEHDLNIDIAARRDLSGDGRWEIKTHVFHANAYCMIAPTRDRSKKRNPERLITTLSVRNFNHLRP